MKPSLSTLRPRSFVRFQPSAGSVVAALAWLALTLLPATGRAQAGSQDATYRPPQLNESVRAIALDPGTGQAVVGGYFSSYYEPPPVNAFTSVSGVARINTDGTLDKTFAPSLSRPSVNAFVVNAVAVQADHKVIVVGNFIQTDVVPHNGIARLLSNGQPDLIANPNLGTGADGEVKVVALQADGKILVGGEFRNFNGLPALGLLRLNADLTRDTSFVLPNPAIFSSIETLIVQPDGRILIQFGGKTPRRLTASGSLDASFDPSGVPAAIGQTATTTVEFETVTYGPLALQTDGKVLTAVVYTTSTGGGPPYTFTASLVRLTANGSLDTSFDYAAKISGPAADSLPTVTSIVPQPDGTVVFGGINIATVNGVAHKGIARLQLNGLQDGAFNATSDNRTGLGPVLALQADGRLLASTISARFPLVRLNDLNAVAHPAFFNGEAALGNGAYYLAFSNGSSFGYYSYLADPSYIYHFDLGYEYVFPEGSGGNGVYLYDFASSSFFYTSPSFGFPYLYDFSLRTTLYYYPDTKNAGHYTTNPRYFFNFRTGQIITK